MGWTIIKNRDELEAFYLKSLPAIRLAAKEQGYAIGVHGSLRRDFDLMAMPWIEKHSSKDSLAEAIQLAACGFTMAKYSWEEKPNGRMATTFPICTVDWGAFEDVPLGLCHIDLSIITIPTQNIKGERER